MELSKLTQMGASRAFLELTTLFSTQIDAQLSLTDLNVLFCIGAHGDEGIAAQFVADELQLDEQLAAKSIRKLLKLDLNRGCDGIGVVEYVLDAFGRKSHLVRLSYKGEALIAQLKDKLP